MTQNTPRAGVSADQSEWTVPALAVLAFLDGDGCDDEAFASLQRRLTLATPWILDSAAGRDYSVQKIAEAEKRGAVKAAQHLVAYSWSDRMDWNSGYEVLEAVREEAGRIESGEITP